MFYVFFFKRVFKNDKKNYVMVENDTDHDDGY